MRKKQSMPLCPLLLVVLFVAAPALSLGDASRTVTSKHSDDTRLVREAQPEQTPLLETMSVDAVSPEEAEAEAIHLDQARGSESVLVAVKAEKAGRSGLARIRSKLHDKAMTAEAVRGMVVTMSDAGVQAEEKVRSSGLDRISSELHDKAVPEAVHTITDSGEGLGRKAVWLVVFSILFVWLIFFIAAYLKATKQYQWHKYTERTRLQLDKDCNPQRILNQQGILEWQCFGFMDHTDHCDKLNCDCKWKVPGRWVPVAEGAPYDKCTISGEWVAEDHMKTQYAFIPKTREKQPCEWVPDPQRTMWRDFSELCEEQELRNILMPTHADYIFLGITFLDTAWMRACFSRCGRHENRPKWLESGVAAIVCLWLGTNPLVFFLVATIEFFYFYHYEEVLFNQENESGYRDPGPRTHFPFANAEQITCNTVAEYHRADSSLKQTEQVGSRATIEVLKKQILPAVDEEEVTRLKQLLIERRMGLEGVDTEKLKFPVTKKTLDIDSRKGEQAPDGLDTPSEDKGGAAGDQHHIEVGGTFQETEASHEAELSLWETGEEVQEENDPLLPDENSTSTRVRL